MKCEYILSTTHLGKKLRIEKNNNWLHLRKIVLKSNEPYKIFLKNNFNDAEKVNNLQRKTVYKFNENTNTILA